MDAVVTRLHEALLDALNIRGEGDRPVSVAEIYQELIPYRNVRSQIGVEMNADYEYALLRLLAGEGGFARIEPAEAREALRGEIASPNPNVSLYRKFAGCDVWVDTSRGFVRAPRAEPIDLPAIEDNIDEPERTEAEVTRATPPRFTFIDPEARSYEQEPVVEPIDESGESIEWQMDEEDVAHCAFCSETLPIGRTVNFCPYCGADQRNQPCPSCGEVLQPDWRFCPSCGATVAGGGASA